MKRIHLVVPYQSVAMRRMYEPLVTELSKLYTITYSDEVDAEADLNYHIPWHTMVGYEGGKQHAIAYTHCNAGAEGILIDACERADLITCMTFTGRQELVNLGVDPAKIWVIYSAADQYAFKKRIVGIIGYPQPNGRKRESILLDLAWQFDMTPFQFLFVGAGWEDTVSQLNSLGVAASFFHADTDEQLRSVYHQIDLLLVTGYVEGGPLPVLEAMASGTDILSPAFGYSNDLLSAEQIYTTVEDLARKLDERVAPAIHRHKLVRAWRWQDYCAEHALIFGRLLGESVDLYPNAAMSRYEQIIEIIEQEKPRVIAEIGTWNGSRAIQMIQAASKHRDPSEIEYHGFDLFDEQTIQQVRSELSKHSWEADLVQARINTTGANVKLITGNTLKTLPYSHMSPDFIFVDGGHSESTVTNDGLWTLMQMADHSVVVFDDYYHEGKPDGMGCNRFIESLPSRLYEVTHLPVRTRTDDGREIGMVKVRKNADIHL
jgi:glycosyltransferase involved in cell wall biosynthesis/predicted O-methyltransferase YrrM